MVSAMTPLLQSLQNECEPQTGECSTDTWNLKWSGEGIAIAHRDGGFGKHWPDTPELALHLSQTLTDVPNHWLGALLGKARRVVSVLSFVVRVSSTQRLRLAAHFPRAADLEGLPEMAVSGCERISPDQLTSLLTTLRALGSPLASGTGASAEDTEGHALHPDVFDEKLSGLREQLSAQRSRVAELQPLTSRVEQLNADVQTLQNEQADLVQQRLELTSRNKHLEDELSELRHQVEHLRTLEPELSQALQQLQEHQSQADAFKREIRTLQQTLARRQGNTAKHNTMKTLDDYNRSRPFPVPREERLGLACPDCARKGIEQELVEGRIASSTKGESRTYEWTHVLCLHCGYTGVKRTD